MDHVDDGGRLHDVIPNELVIQILFKVPAKSIVQFKCVCKSWCSVIDSPSFIDQHMIKSAPYILVNSLHHCTNESYETNYRFATRMLSYNTLKAVSTRWFSPAAPYPRRDNNLELANFLIMGCCNGLVLIVDCEGVDVDHDFDFHVVDEEEEDYYYGNDNDNANHVNYILWNFATGERKVLPTCLSRSRRDYKRDVLFETVGFGFDAQSKDYKVLVMHKLINRFNNYPPASVVVEVYSLGTDSWKAATCLSDTTTVTNLKDNNGVFCNGMYSWMVNVGIFFELRAEIISFDMSKEEIARTHLPNDICTSTSPGSNTSRLFVYNESLAVVNCVRESHGLIDSGYDTWVLGEFGVKESWTRLFSIANVDRGFTTIERLKGLWKDDKALVQSNTDELILQDAFGEKLRSLGIFGQEMKLFFYRESLVPLKSESKHLGES